MSESPPVWRRGLKPQLPNKCHTPHRVASRVEAWIETVTPRYSARSYRVASRVEAWIETCRLYLCPQALGGRLPCGGVD